jgi:hypothetical protein
MDVYGHIGTSIEEKNRSTLLEVWRRDNYANSIPCYYIVVDHAYAYEQLASLSPRLNTACTCPGHRSITIQRCSLPTASTDGDGAGCRGLIGCWPGWTLPLSAGRSATHLHACCCGWCLYLYLYLYLDMHRGCGTMGAYADTGDDMQHSPWHWLWSFGDPD